MLGQPTRYSEERLKRNQNADPLDRLAQMRPSQTIRHRMNSAPPGLHLARDFKQFEPDLLKDRV